MAEGSRLHMTRRLMIFAVVLLSWLFPALDTHASQQEYMITRVEHAQLFKRNIHAIVQDHIGFIWLATDNGLLRFDGNDVVVHRHEPDNPNSLPSNIVRAAYIDDEGNLWVGSSRGGLSLYRPDTGDFETFRPEEGKMFNFWSVRPGSDNTIWLASIFEPVIYRFNKTTREFETIPIPIQNTQNALFAFDVLETSTGEIWIGTVEDGVIVLDADLNQIANHRSPGDWSNGLYGNSIRNMVEDHHGFIWIGGYRSYVSRYNPEDGSFRSPDHDLFESLMNVYQILIDKENETVWVAADGGLLVLDIFTLEIREHYGFDPANNRSLSNDRPRAIFTDRSGIVWVGNEHGGVHNLLRRNAFRHVTPQPGNRDAIQNRFVRSFLTVSDTELWVANDTEIAVLDPDTYHVRRFIRNLPGKQLTVGVTVMEKSLDGGFLIGTWGDGLIHYNPQTGRHRIFRSVRGDPTTLSDNRIQVIYYDSKDRLWIGTENGLNLLNLETGTFRRVLYDARALAGTFDYSIQSGAFVEFDDDIFWVGTWNGLIRLDLRSGTHRTITMDSGQGRSLLSNHILALHRCENDNLWIATFGGGLSRMALPDETITTITDTEGLSSSVLFTIVPGPGADIWLSSNNGLIRYNTETHTFRNFTEQDGIGMGEFWWGAGYASPTGKLYFGSIFGFVSFDPAEITESTFNPPVVLSELRLFEQVVPIQTASKLSFRENYLSFNYASLDFANPSRIEYRHKLEGLDNDWIYTGNRSYASYSSIPPGSYVFRVQATNRDGVWSTYELAVPVSISPPFWQTSPFYLLVIVFVVMMVYGTIQWRTASISERNRTLEAQVNKRTRDLARKQEELSESNEALREKSERLSERNQEIEAQKNQLLETSNELLLKNAQLKKINQEKNNLIGIVAHDLRSPLASVISGLEVVRMSPEMSREEINEIHEMMQGFINKQLDLIGRILDHQAMDSGNLTVSKKVQSIVPIIENLITSYADRAEQKNLTIRLNKPPTLRNLPLDGGITEQIIDNLLSNAIKFSNPNGSITVTLLDTHDEIWVGIKDNGPGISDADKDKLFGKFQKLSARPTGGEQSTGLGLSIVKQLTDAVEGRVWCESEHGEGATFWVALSKVS